MRIINIKIVLRGPTLASRHCQSFCQKIRMEAEMHASVAPD